MAESHFEQAPDEVIDEPRSARLTHSVPRGIYRNLQEGASQFEVLRPILPQRRVKPYLKRASLANFLRFMFMYHVVSRGSKSSSQGQRCHADCSHTT